MRRRNFLKKATAFVCVAAIAVTSVPFGENIKAATLAFDDEKSSVMIDKGGYKTEVYGVGTDDWGKTTKDRTQTLPPSKTYLTDNYRNTVGTVPTSDWASSVVFDKYSESLYAHPLAYRAASNGMQMAYPAVSDAKSYVDGEPSVESLLEDDTVELVVGADGFKAKDASVDKTTDWTYEIVMEDESKNASMRSTIAKGTPYAYYKFNNLSPTISLGAGATDLKIYKRNTSSNIMGVSVKNKKDNKTHYYSINAPKGTTWTNAGGKLTANLPSGADYMSVAILPDGSDEAFTLYEKYAFNFITDTKVEWEYLENSSKVLTKYNVTTTNMETGAEGGDTIIALYPHQWRYADENYTNYTYKTIRGTMKTIVGTSYVTKMTYSGILSTLPVTKDAATIGEIKDQLGYLYDYRKNKADPKWISFLEGQYGGYDTYWVGKNLNTLSDAILLANQFGDADMQNISNEMVKGMEGYLEFWFDPFQAYKNGATVDSYFYYNKDYGTLIGYPASYSSDKEVNDHHFHYGYWIKAAATIAMKDPQWIKEWSGMVYEMISDIANTNRDGSSYNKNSQAKYPFLRNFDIYEGHSWASGVANYEYDENGNLIDKNGGLSGGNNQESSSESVNAWSSLIMWGDAVGDEKIRDLGIYMYTTEIAAIEDYYYDVHNEIFTENYKDANNYNIQTVTRLFGGRYDHTAWWTENPIEVTTITMLPISGSTLYLGKYRDKVKAVVDSIGETSKQWNNFVTNKQQICNNYGKVDMLTDPKTNQDIIAEYYAYYDADKAYEMYDRSDTGKVENGESRAHTIAYITSLKEYGTQDFDITASSPMALVLSKNGVKTYIAQNNTDKDERVYFSDGTYIDVEANSSYVGDKTGNGQNPESDDSELEGSKQKCNINKYLENLSGDGYEVSSRTISVKSDDGTYTYVPEEITGFTFDDSADNVLKVKVEEGKTADVNVYYKRNTYSISYSLDGGKNSELNPVSYKYGEKVTLNNPSKDGYIFKGWYIDSKFENKIESITEANAENINLYAYFVDSTLLTTYTVNHYIQDEDSIQYKLVEKDAEVIDSVVGTKVTAIPKTYEGYHLNEKSVLSGVVLKEGRLVINVYYDLDSKDDQGSVILGDKGASVDENNNLTMYVADEQDKATVLVYYLICNNETEAKQAYNNAVEYNGRDVPGYFMEKDNGIFKKAAGTVSDDQYVVYRFNIQDKELTEWTMVSIAALKNPKAEKKAIEINGYQISTTAKGMRTVYSVESRIDGKNVEERGMVYALTEYATDAEIYVGSESKYVKNFKATEKGVLSDRISDSDTATSYAMTMKFDSKNPKEYTTGWAIRAYAKLSDGTYVYSDIAKYTIRDVADYLYINSLMPTEAAHNYLYTDILSLVDDKYPAKAYNKNNELVLAE